MDKLKIAFVVEHTGLLENFSVSILSAVAKARGHEVRLIVFGSNPGRAMKEILSFRPDIAAYSICSNQAGRFHKINHALKQEMKFYSLFGGPHPTFFPGFIEKEGVDAICRGEGDLCFPKFLDHFGTEKMYEINNFTFKVKPGHLVENPLGDLVEDLSVLPYPDRDIIYGQSRVLANMPMKAFMAGRGCPYGCSYCFNHVYNSMYKDKGKVLRTKSVSYLIDEIRRTAEKYPLSFIKFFDDIFGHDIEWLEEFAHVYRKEIGLPFLCYTRVNIVTEEYCRLLKKAGCYSILTAVECGSERIRNKILNRNIADEQIVSACKTIKQHGFRLYLLNMVGLPGESEKEMYQTVEINRQAGADFTDCFIFQPYPGTKITDYCIKNGYLDKNFENYQNQFGYSVLNFDSELKKRIFVIQNVFAFLVDYPWFKLLLKPLFLLGKSFIVRKLLTLAYRFNYGYKAHRRIYAGVPVPLKNKLGIALFILFSRDKV